MMHNDPPRGPHGYRDIDAFTKADPAVCPMCGKRDGHTMVCLAASPADRAMGNRAERRKRARSRGKGPELATEIEQVHPELIKAIMSEGAYAYAQNVQASAAVPVGPVATPFRALSDDEVADVESRGGTTPTGCRRIYTNEALIVFVCDRPGGMRHLMIRHHTGQGDLSWDLLQWVKLALGYGDAEAVEIYPRQSLLRNSANVRHLWLLPPGIIMPFGLDDDRKGAGIDQWPAVTTDRTCGCACSCGMPINPAEPAEPADRCPSCRTGDCDPEIELAVCKACDGSGCDVCVWTGLASVAGGAMPSAAAIERLQERGAL